MKQSTHTNPGGDEMSPIKLNTAPEITDEVIDGLLNKYDANYEVATIPTPNPFGNDPTGFYSSYRTDTNKVFAQGLSKQWKPIQNRDSMKILAQLSKHSDVKIDNFYLFGGGRELCAQINLGDHDLGGGDKVSNYMSMFNGHDGGHSMSLFESGLRHWCLNVINASIADAKSRKSIMSIRHTTSAADQLEILLTSIKMSQGKFAQTIELYQKLRSIVVKPTLAYDIIESFYPAFICSRSFR